MHDQYWLGEDKDKDMDFDAILNVEYNHLIHGLHISKNLFQRFLEHKMETFIGSAKHKKLASVYYPVDKSQLNKCGGGLPPILFNAQVQVTPRPENKGINIKGPSKN